MNTDFSERIDAILERISELQDQKTAGIPDGLLPSFRENTFWGYRRIDSNIFASASVAFLLKECLDHFTTAQKQKAQRIIDKIIKHYPNYQNVLTFNFWPKGGNDFFPNGHFFKYFRHFKLPDDIDDTALIYLTMGIDEHSKQQLKTKLEEQLHHGVYNTWFGLKMPKETDLCAICNLVSLIEEVNSKTFAYICQQIETEGYLKNPFWISRHYGSRPLIIYHLARMLERTREPALLQHKTKVAKQITQLAEQPLHKTERLILQTAYIKLTRQLPDFGFKVDKNRTFYSFLGAPFAPLAGLLKKLANKKAFVLGWKCEAHELALALENIVHYARK